MAAFDQWSPFDTKPNCLGSHGLKKFKSPVNTHICDKCSRTFPPGHILYGCRICDCDLCVDCYDNIDKSETKCNSGHPLFHTSNRAETDQLYSQGWICSKCLTAVYPNVKSYHCRLCQYDLCSKCNQQQISDNAFFSNQSCNEPPPQSFPV